MAKRIILLQIFISLLFPVNILLSQNVPEPGKLPGFYSSPYFDEQIITFSFAPEIKIHINAAAKDNFDSTKPVGLALYALPNGNSIKQTVGKILQPGDDWHFDIQHIGAQTRFLRQQIDDYNLVTVYLETRQKSWPAWKAQHPDHADIIKSLVDYLKSCFKAYHPFVVLTGHSGGGRFSFSFMDAFNEIPDYVKRISFLDSNYGYENRYGDKMIQWLKSSTDHFLCVLAYNDSIALYNGKPIVSPTGGTWYRSRMMQNYFADYFSFRTEEDENFIRHTALNGRIKILLKKNPEKKILHTVQVERNGFIHAMLTGTSKENIGYEYYGDRVYSDRIQVDRIKKRNLMIPLRSANAKSGSEFMDSIKNMSFEDREKAIYSELSTGNLPNFLREVKQIEAVFTDAKGNAHQVKYEVMPDYLAVGSDSDFCRIPMGPITAQKLADLFGASLPTRKLVDDIYHHAEIKLEPVTYTPVGHENEKVQKFIEHNQDIEKLRILAGGSLGQLIGGIKKDVVLSNKITDPARPGHVVIYGWHRLNGVAIQPLTNIHVDWYVDYSHGIRLLNSEIKISGTMNTIQTVLKNSTLYKLLSDETGVMQQPTYISNNTLPGRPKSFGVKSVDQNRVKIVLKSNSSAEYYQLFTSADGLTFGAPITFNSIEYILEGLPPDSIIYIKLRAGNAQGLSPESEVLAGFPTSKPPGILIVNGFDRSSAGNSYNFIRQHAGAIVKTGKPFDSATNDAVTDFFFDLKSYDIVDYILGDESTADETFSGNEQWIVSSYLRQGGRLFVSGSEVAWDLDYKGSSTDKNFFRNYLKATYSADAPNGVAGIYYQAEGVAGTLFAGLSNISFDNGSHGTFNVKYADAISAVNGGQNVIRYKDVANHTIGGVSFAGTFPGGNKIGKLVYIGFPFETIYPESIRNAVMKDVLTFLESNATVVNDAKDSVPNQFYLMQNYPNPFSVRDYFLDGNSATTIQYNLSKQSDVTVVIYNSLGSIIQKWKRPGQNKGVHKIVWDGADEMGIPVSSGTYFYRMIAGNFDLTRKMVILR